MDLHEFAGRSNPSYHAALEAILNASPRPAGLRLDARRGGLTALHVSCREGNVRGARLLLTAGADKEAASREVAGVRFSHETPLHVACERGHLDIVRLLVGMGASVRAVAQTGWTPLHFAALKGHVDIIRVLLAAGASKTARDTSGRTPLEVAIINHQTSAVRVLTEGQLSAQTALALTAEPGVEGGTHPRSRL